MVSAVLIASCGGIARHETSEEGHEAAEGPPSSGPVEPAAQRSPEPMPSEAQPAQTQSEPEPVRPEPAEPALEPEPSEPKPAPSIDGRWGMTAFEDPVGVSLQQSDGVLSGEGCVVGAPGGFTPMPVSLCGPLTGQIDGRNASFEFDFELAVYKARVVVSEDGQRMAGRFKGVGEEFLAWTTAWIRVDPEQLWLSSGGEQLPEDLLGDYDLNLSKSSTDGSDFSFAVTYTLTLSKYYAIYGDLGAFWYSEIAPLAPDATALKVGPVAPTLPELPVELELRLAGGELSEVLAKTAAGDEYLFEAIQRPSS